MSKKTVPKIPLGYRQLYKNNYDFTMEPKIPTACVIYCRVSSAEQVLGTSLEMQERLCKEYAARENMEVRKVFVDKGESAKSADRTEFQKAIAFCADKKNKIDHFVVYKLDRFARNQEDHVTVRAILRKFGTSLRSVTEPIDDTPIGKAMEGMFAVWAELDNNIRAERSKNGMVEKVKRGEWVWAAPLGYKRIRKGGNLIVNEGPATYIQFVFEQYAKGGHTYQSLADLVYKAGMRTKKGKKPHPQLIEKILRNHVYYGKIRAFGLEVKGDFEAIIDEELFWRCQPKSLRRSHSGPRLKQNHEFPLRHFVRCSECGKPLTGSASTGRKGKRYPYYHHHKQGCPLAKMVPREAFEKRFLELLEKISPDLQSEKAFRAVVTDVWQSNFKRLDADNSRIRREIETLETERQKIFEMHRTGKYSDEEFYEQKQIITSRIYEKKNALNEKSLEEFKMDEALDYCFNFVRESHQTWKRLAPNPLLRDRFQKTVFPENIYFDGKKFGTTKISLVYKINQKKNLRKPNMVTPRGIEPRFPA